MAVDVKILYTNVPEGAMEGSTTTGTYAQEFVDFDDFHEQKQVLKYATLEENRCLLDGTFLNFPDNPTDIGYMSTIMSDGEGNFPNTITITRTYDQNYTSPGLQFVFDTWTDDHPATMTVKWYRGTTQLESRTYTVNSSIFFADANVTAYNKVVITFTNMTRLSRFLKIYSISDGIAREFYNEEIIDVDIIESTNINCEELPISEATVTLMPISTLGVIFQRTLPMEIYRKIEGEYQLFAKFYITSYTVDNKKKIYKIKLGDAISILENQTYLGGIIDTTPTELLNDLLGDFTYTYNGNNTAHIQGYLPIMNKREALRQICQVLGVQVRTARTLYGEDISLIDKLNMNTIIINNSRIYNYTVAEDNIVTDIELRYNYLSQNTMGNQNLFNEALDGTTTVYFGSPTYNLSISGGTIVESNCNYAIISGTGGTVNLTGRQYQQAERVYVKENPLAVSTDIKKTLSINTTLWFAYGNYTPLTDLFFVKKKINIKLNPLLTGSNKILVMHRSYGIAGEQYYKPTTISYSLKQPSVVMNAELEMI